MAKKIKKSDKVIENLTEHPRLVWNKNTVMPSDMRKKKKNE